MTITLVAPMDFPHGRPGCPWWCTGTCQDPTDEMHTTSTDIPASGGKLTLTAWEAAQFGITVYAAASEQSIGAHVDLTVPQARRFATELLTHADLIDPAPAGEIDVPATEVKVGDLFQVDGEWRYVYSVDVDEPSLSVQVFTTIERGVWPELDGNEDPHEFELTAWIRVRRGGAS